jgi:hypothetical protein
LDGSWKRLGALEIQECVGIDYAATGYCVYVGKVLVLAAPQKTGMARMEDEETGPCSGPWLTSW